VHSKLAGALLAGQGHRSSGEIGTSQTAKVVAGCTREQTLFAVVCVVRGKGKIKARVAIGTGITSEDKVVSADDTG
jgi:hypothetical protein